MLMGGITERVHQAKTKNFYSGHRRSGEVSWKKKGASPECTTTDLRTCMGQRDINLAIVVRMIVAARRWSIRDAERASGQKYHEAVPRWKERKK